MSYLVIAFFLDWNFTASLSNIYVVDFEIFSSAKMYLRANVANKPQLFSKVSLLKSLSSGVLPLASVGLESTFALQSTELGRPEILLQQTSW